MRGTILIASLAAGFAAIALTASPGAAESQRSAAAQTSDDQPRQRRGLFRRNRGSEAPPADLVISYGEDPLQDIGLYFDGRRSGTATPLVVFVHGGGWRMGNRDNATGEYKAGHYTQLGYNFASVNYRLVPKVTVEEQAQDVADAVKALVDRANELGIHPGKIVLMGHSAGAHLVALVSTDPQYLRAAGLSLDAIAGTIPLDGAAYDVPAQLSDAGRFMDGVYEQAFGNDTARQRALSPTLQAAAPNVSDFLILYVQREDGTRQSRALAAALEEAGSNVTHRQFNGRGLRGHAQINRELGDPDYPATPVVDAWLEDLFAT